LAAAVVGGVGVLATLASAGGSPLDRAVMFLVIGLLVAGVVGVIVNESRVKRERVLVDLDGSRRWVTLRGVHPDFVAACHAQEQRQEQRT
jgi:hypothetical protein